MILFSLPDYEYLARPLLKLPGFRRGRFAVSRFPNQEISISVDTRVHGQKCVVLGGVAPPDGDLLSMLLLSHTLKTEGAAEITAVLPYLGYARQDRKEIGKSLAAQWLGKVLRASGVDRVVTIDIHSQAVKRLFSVPLISLSPKELFAREIAEHPLGKVTLVAPDEGAVDDCKALGRALGISAPIAYFNKKRTSGGIRLSELHGKVTGNALLVDDILDTGETLLCAAEKLRRYGVHSITVIVTHGLFTGKIWRKLLSVGVRRIYCTDSFPKSRKLASRRIVFLPAEEIVAKYFL